MPELQKFGICQRCGTDGKDNSADLTSADAPARTTAGNGVYLESYNGKDYCNICINELKSEAQSLETNRKIAEDQKFRAKAGFTDSI